MVERLNDSLYTVPLYFACILSAESIQRFGMLRVLCVYDEKNKKEEEEKKKKKLNFKELCTTY